MKINPENFIKVDTPEFLILETIDNSINHLNRRN